MNQDKNTRPDIASADDAEVFDDINQAADQAEASEEFASEAGADDEEETDPIGQLQAQLDQANAQLEKEKKEYLFLMAEFDNFRKRTLKEKAEILKNGGEKVLLGLLPIVDDFERGLDAIADTDNAEAVKEGMALIYNKLVRYLEQNGVKAMETNGLEYDADLHEALALVPGDEANKGKIIDTMQKGYMINDKVLRHAKVAVGQ